MLLAYNCVTHSIISWKRIQPVYFISITQITSIHLQAAAPASESKESLLKATVEDEQDEEDEEEDNPAMSESVRRAGGSGSRGLGKSQPFSLSSLSSAVGSLGPFVMAARGGSSE